MTKIFCVGQDMLTGAQENVLSSSDRSIVKFTSVDAMILRQKDSPDLIIIDREQSKQPSIRKFLSLFKDVPKIVYSRTHPFKGIGWWIRCGRTFPLADPSPRELEFTVSLALRDRDMSVENADLKKRLSAMSREMEFLDSINTTFSSASELTEVLKAILKKAKKFVSAEVWSVMLRDKDTGELVSIKTSPGKGGKSEYRLKPGKGIAGWVAQEGIPVIIPDVSTEARSCNLPGTEAASKTKSLICVPIKSKEGVIGVLEIANTTKKRPFTREDLNLLQKLVRHAALAIERASLYRKMAELSITDDLTKLFNTRYLNRTLEIEVSRADRHSSSFSLIFMDIDHFKIINDNYGHLVGSKLLVEMGQLLIKWLRTVDIVARYGGDEFVIVLPQTAPGSAVQTAERIRKAIEQNVFLRKEGYSLKLTASFGVASYPESAKSKEDLLRLADEAMYRVKYRTRNGVYAIV